MHPQQPLDVDAIADLVDEILVAARRIQATELTDPGLIRLSPLERLVMRFVDRNPGAAPSLLVAELELRSSNASATLRSLEEKGLIERRPDPTDRRGVRIHATAVAHRNLGVARAAWARLVGPALPEGSSAADALAVVSAVRTALEAQRSPGGSGQRPPL